MWKKLDKSQKFHRKVNSLNKISAIVQASRGIVKIRQQILQPLVISESHMNSGVEGQKRREYLWLTSQVMRWFYRQLWEKGVCIGWQAGGKAADRAEVRRVILFVESSQKPVRLKTMAQEISNPQGWTEASEIQQWTTKNNLFHPKQNSFDELLKNQTRQRNSELLARKHASGPSTWILSDLPLVGHTHTVLSTHQVLCGDQGYPSCAWPGCDTCGHDRVVYSSMWHLNSVRTPGSQSPDTEWGWMAEQDRVP